MVADTKMANEQEVSVIIEKVIDKVTLIVLERTNLEEIKHP